MIFCAQFGKFCFRFALPYETVYVMSIWLVGIGKINIPETEILFVQFNKNRMLVYILQRLTFGAAVLRMQYVT